MANIQRLWVIVTTANVADADTENKFDLVIKAAPNPNFEARFHFPDLPNPDERERARTDEYPFEVGTLNVSMDLVNGNTIAMEILGNDAWLPSSIWVIGEDVDGTRKLLVGIPRWPANRWWSTDTSEGQPSRLLRV
jgi:hypothetical protein